MSNGNGNGAKSKYGSSPLQSKKFVAYLVAEGTWKLILASTLLLGIKEGAIDVLLASIALAIIVIAGFIEAGFILGQASLDKYTRIAEIAASAGKNFSMKGVNIHPPNPPKPTSPPEPEDSSDGDESDEG